MFEIDPGYKVVNRIIEIDGVNDIKVFSLDFVVYEDQSEVLGYEG